MSAASPAARGVDRPFATLRDRLLRGPQSIRVAGERRTLVLCIMAAPLLIVLVGLFFHGITVSEVALLVVAGLVLVSLARGRLLGGSIRVTENQFPEVYHEVQEIAGRLGVRPPVVFLRDDPFVPVTSIGTEEPYAIVISSQYFDHLSPGELRFLIARELGHIAAGHTRVASIFSASGRENPFVSIVFGSWMRKTEYTADRIGVLFCDLQDAVRAIAITTFHAIGRRVNHEVLDEQRRELEEDPRLRLGEWSSATPFATNRIRALSEFALTPDAEFWRNELASTLSLPAPQPQTAGRGTKVTRADCGSPGWRFVALLIDLVVVSAIIQSGIEITGVKEAAIGKEKDLAWLVTMFPQLAHMSVNVEMINPRTALALLVYSAGLVALSGQTLGMMVSELHVVNTRFGRVGTARSIVRYVAGGLSALLVVPGFVGLFMKRQPHDWITGTRVVRNRPALTDKSSPKKNLGTGR